MAEKLDIPEIAKPLVSKRGLDTLLRVKQFVDQDVLPNEGIFEAQISEEPEKRWASFPSVIEELKQKARQKDLWNLFLCGYKEGPGFTNVEYGLMCEQLGRTKIGPEAVNSSAPDTGNMEVLAKYGNPEQKKKWLEPLLNGEIRSAFLMTEKFSPSSDATNIALGAEIVGDDVILNGTKWWSSGAGDPRCKLWLVMALTNPDSPDPYKKHSVLIVDAEKAQKNGATVVRPLNVMGFDEAPHGHMEINFRNCRVPLKGNVVLGLGRGFEVIQGRLGPGRIHHCMRSIGAAEEALARTIRRIDSRVTFGKKLSAHGAILEKIAKMRVEIDQARLLVLNAAAAIDNKGASKSRKEIAIAKVVAPSTSLKVLDFAIQMHGAAGLCQDFPLSFMWVTQRTLRIADGPDEVHLNQLGRNELKRTKDVIQYYDLLDTLTEEAFKSNKSKL